MSVAVYNILIHGKQIIKNTVLPTLEKKDLRPEIKFTNMADCIMLEK